MSSEKLKMPASRSFPPLSETASQIERTQETRDLFNLMNHGRTQGLDRSLGIMCKMGPSTESVQVLEDMIVAGMNIAMIKCAEMSGEEHIRDVVAKIREANDRVSKTLNVMLPVAICVKTVGPEMYIGNSEEGEDGTINLETGSEVTITFDPAYKDKCNKDVIYVDYQGSGQGVDLKLHNRVLLDRGKIKLKVIEAGISDECVSTLCNVVIGGVIPSGAVVSFPDAFVKLPTISEQDSKNIQLAIELRCDILMITHLQSKSDVDEVRQTLIEKNSPMFIMASITDVEGFHNVDEIIEATDGVGIPRGYVERNPVNWNLYLATKTIIAKCRSLGKPTIVTSKFLAIYKGSLELQTPDVANCVQVVMEGADVFGLGYEVAFGTDPVHIIRSCTETCKEANKQIKKEDLIDDITNVILKCSNVMESVLYTAVILSLRIDAAAIIVLTENGKEARCLSTLRPISPIIAVTHYGHIARQQPVKNLENCAWAQQDKTFYSIEEYLKDHFSPE